MTHRYKIILDNRPLSEDRLNQFAAQGLEFCSESNVPCTGGSYWRYIFRIVVLDAPAT
jgi:hypothetical protein